MNFLDDIEIEQVKKVKTKQKKANWTLEDQTRFIIFIFAHKQVFQEQKIRDRIIFQEMGKYIGSKDFQQCCTHYSKIRKQYASEQNNTTLKCVEYFRQNLQIEPEKLNEKIQEIREKKMQNFKRIQKTLVTFQNQMISQQLMGCFRKGFVYDQQFVKELSLLENNTDLNGGKKIKDVEEKDQSYEKPIKLKRNNNFEDQQILTPDKKKSIVQLSQNQKRANLIQQIKKYQSKKWQNLSIFRYLIFLLFYSNQYERASLKKKSKWNLIMSKVIDNTGVETCRSTHKKNLQKFKNIEGIINHFKMTISYININIQDQIKRFLEIVQQTEETKQQFYKMFIQNQFREENARILQFYSTGSPVLRIREKDKQIQNNFDIQSKQNTEQKKKSIITTVEVLVIIKRQTLLNDGHQANQTKKINQIIKKYSKGLKIKKRFRKYLTKQTQTDFCPFILSNPRINNQLSVEKQYTDKIQKVRQIQLAKPQHFKCTHRRCFKKINKNQWRKPQLIKLLIFLQIMKEKCKKQDLDIIQNINLKCSQYINTDKTADTCKHKINYFRNLFKQQFWNLIEKQAENYSIPQKLIEMEKQRYILLENNPPQCCIQLQIKKNQEVCEFPSEYKNEFVEKSLKSKYNLLVKFKMNSQQKSSDQKTKQKQSSRLITQRCQINKKLKYIMEIQLSNQMFLWFKKSLGKNEYIYKTINKIAQVQKISFSEENSIKS